MKTMKIISAVALIFCSILPHANAQELGDLNLPTSGLTEETLASKDALWKRYIELTVCEGGSMILGDKEIGGSSDCIRFAPWEGDGFISNMMDGTEQSFDRVSLEGDDLPACEFYLYLRGHGNVPMLTVLAKPEKYAQTFLAVNVSGATASANSQQNAIIMSDIEITWMALGDDPLGQRILRNKLLSATATELLVPYNSGDIDKTARNIGELGQVCAALF